MMGAAFCRRKQWTGGGGFAAGNRGARYRSQGFRYQVSGFAKAESILN